MNYLHLNFPTPAENLAADEALLDLAENEGVETLRIWESAIPFVVLGLSNHVAHEVAVAACAQRGIPILVLTTESTQEMKERARAAGATGWISKPFDPDHLAAALRRVGV